MKNTRHALKNLFVGLFFMGLAFSMLALTAPFIGLGARGTYILFRWFGLNRTFTLLIGLVLSGAAFFNLKDDSAGFFGKLFDQRKSHKNFWRIILSSTLFRLAVFLIVVGLPLGALFLTDYLGNVNGFPQVTNLFRNGVRGAYQASFDLVLIGLVLLIARCFAPPNRVFWLSFLKRVTTNTTGFIDGPYGLVFLCILGTVGALTGTGILFLPLNAQLAPREDHTVILVIARTLLHHASLIYNHDLGFPIGADHYYFPLTNYWVFLNLWVGSLFINNVFGLVQFYYVISVSLIFLSCFFSLLWLEIERIPAFLIAVAYCILPFAGDRFSSHDTYAAYYAVPMAAALALHLGRIKPLDSLKQTVLQNVATPFIMIALIGIAWADIYYAFFAAFFIGIAGFSLSVGNRKIEPLVVAMAQIAIITMLFGICLLPYLGHGEKFPVRGPDDQYFAAIRIPDFLYSFPNVSWLAQKYDAYTHSIRPHTEGTDFWPGSVLSFIVLLSPVFVMVSAARQTAKPLLNSRVQIIGLAALLISAAVLFGLPESYGYLFNMLITGSIRAQNRCSVFVAFFAFVILASILSLLKIRMQKYRFILVFVFAVLLLVNVWPVLGYSLRTEHEWENNKIAQANFASVRVGLTVLHNAHAQNVLQLPVAGWPEVPNIGKFVPYDHLLFYIYDAPQSPMRWSYGIDWNQPEYAALKRLGNALEAEPDKQTWMPFRCLGFDAVIIEKAAYDSATISKIEMSLKRLGIKTPLFEDERRAVFTLATLPHDLAACPQPVAKILAGK